MRPIIQKESKFIQYRERKNMKDFGFLGVHYFFLAWSVRFRAEIMG